MNHLKVNKPTLRVLHLSDLHIDRDYVEGSEADCQGDNWLDTYALCCRNYTEKTQGIRFLFGSTIIELSINSLYVCF